MDEGRLAHALSNLVGLKLATELASDFVKVRRDHATSTLERASPGKFVETFIQCLQYMSTRTYEEHPSIEAYLTKRAENLASLSEGLRVIAPRVARMMYTLRSKRNIVHKNSVDPNTFDLSLLHQSAAWIMAELLRNASGLSMQEAGKLIDLVRTPVGTLVEEIEGTHLVHATVSLRAEILILLHSRYPEKMLPADLKRSMSARSPASVQNRIGELRLAKLIYGDSRNGFRLTQAGYAAAVTEIQSTLSAAA